MTMNAKIGANWKAIESAHVRVAGEWKGITTAWVLESGVWKKFLDGAGGAVLTISASANDVDIFALAGSPAGPVNISIAVDSGVVIGATSTAIAAMSILGFASGSQITLANDGQIFGAGGVGGEGGDGYHQGLVGSDGGKAIEIDLPISIDNTGEIFGGGGGGGGGQYKSNHGVALGGNGGNGAGHNQTRTDGSAGQAVSGQYSRYGGDGGDWGVAGQAGELDGYGDQPYTGASGGGAGKAIETDGNAVTWISGDDAAHLKGAVG
jgi:Phage tail fibre adhesin Gp38